MNSGLEISLTRDHKYSSYFVLLHCPLGMEETARGNPPLRVGGQLYRDHVQAMRWGNEQKPGLYASTYQLNSPR